MEAQISDVNINKLNELATVAALAVLTTQAWELLEELGVAQSVATLSGSDVVFEPPVQTVTLDIFRVRDLLDRRKELLR